MNAATNVYFIVGEIILLTAMYVNDDWRGMRKLPLSACLIAFAVFIASWPVWLLVLVAKRWS